DGANGGKTVAATTTMLWGELTGFVEGLVWTAIERPNTAVTASTLLTGVTNGYPAWLRGSASPKLLPNDIVLYSGRTVTRVFVGTRSPPLRATPMKVVSPSNV